MWPNLLNQKVQLAIKKLLKDYNGRVARLLTNLLALNLGLPLLIIKAETSKDRDRYIKAMKAVDNYDYSKLERLIASALKESLEKV